MARRRTKKRRSTRRKRKYNRAYAYNRKRKRRRNRRSGRRRRWLNPGGIMKATTAGFSMKGLSDAGLVVAGVAGNAWLSNIIASVLPVEFLKEGIGKGLIGLGTAGLLGWGSGQVMSRPNSQLIFLGGVAGVVSDIVSPLIERVTAGIGDFATSNAVAKARSLEGLRSGMGDFATMTAVARAPAQSVDSAMIQGIGEFTGLGGVYEGTGF